MIKNHKPITLVRFYFVISSLLIIFCNGIDCEGQSYVSQGRTLVLAHRGIARKAPENTFASIEMAYREGYDGVEIDVRMAKSGELIVFHDPALERTSSGKGLVEEKTWDELKQLDVGSYFNPRFQGEKIPLLRDVIERYAKKMILYIEIKQPQFPSNNLEDKVAEMILEYGIADRTFVASGNELSIAKIERLYPSIQTVWEYCYIGKDMCLRADNAPPQYTWYLKTINPDYLGPQYNYIDDKFVQWLQENHYQLFAWTVNDAHEMKRLVASGVVKGIQTDYPEILKRIIYHQ